MVLTAYCVKLRKKVPIDDYKIYSVGKNRYMLRGSSSKCPSEVTTFVNFETAQKLTGSSKFPEWKVDPSTKKKKELAKKTKKLKEKEKKLKEKERAKKSKESKKK